MVRVSITDGSAAAIFHAAELVPDAVSFRISRAFLKWRFADFMVGEQHNGIPDVRLWLVNKIRVDQHGNFGVME